MKIDNSTAVYDIKQTLEVNYFETVIEPSFPSLARQYEIDLFSIFSSLIAIIEPDSDSPRNRRPEDVQSFESRRQHLPEWATHIEKAFLNALKLRLLMAKSDSIFQFELYPLGSQFDANIMEALVPIVSEANLNPEQLTLLCMSPRITSSRRASPLASISVAEARVVIEGFEVDYTLLSSRIGPIY